MRIAICDDEREQLRNTREQIEQQYKSLDMLVETYERGADLLADFDRIPYDLVVLDIEMPECDGISVARALRAKSDQVAIVFLTSHVEYALKGYEVQALRYLTKPLSGEKLAEVISYLTEQQKKEKKLLVRTEEDTVAVRISDILYLEAQNQNIRIVTRQNVYQQRYNLRDYEKELSAYHFVRAHRSYLVNLSYISRISNRQIWMDNGENLPLSRTREKQVRELLQNYVKEAAL